MPTKIDPNDWDRLFAPNAPRRGGPLQVLVNILIIGAVFGSLAYGVVFVLERRAQQTAAITASATAVAATVIPQQTAAAVAETSTAAAITIVETATVVAQPPKPKDVLGTGTVIKGGNLRKEPLVAPETIIGLIWPGDEIQFLEPREVDGQFWYRIRITRAAANRPSAGVANGTEGWASETLLSPITRTP